VNSLPLYILTTTNAFSAIATLTLSASLTLTHTLAHATCIARSIQAHTAIGHVYVFLLFTTTFHLTRITH
jgi:hypothetical protein